MSKVVEIVDGHCQQFSYFFVAARDSPVEQQLLRRWPSSALHPTTFPEQASTFRRIGARANYLSQDRHDISYSVKELCRVMSKPTVGGWNRLKELARYLKGKIELEMVYLL